MFGCQAVEANATVGSGTCRNDHLRAECRRRVFRDMARLNLSVEHMEDPWMELARPTSTSRTCGKLQRFLSGFMPCRLQTFHLKGPETGRPFGLGAVGAGPGRFMLVCARVCALPLQLRAEACRPGRGRRCFATDGANRGGFVFVSIFYFCTLAKEVAMKSIDQDAKQRPEPGEVGLLASI